MTFFSNIYSYLIKNNLNCGILSRSDIVGICPVGVSPVGFCLWGFCPVGFCPVGFCLDTVGYDVCQSSARVSHGSGTPRVTICHMSVTCLSPVCHLSVTCPGCLHTGYTEHMLMLMLKRVMSPVITVRQV